MKNEFCGMVGRSDCTSGRESRSKIACLVLRLGMICLMATLGGSLARGQTTYEGNGATGFGGVLGPGSMAISDDGSTINFTLNLTGPLVVGGGINGVVIYVDNGSGGGISNTSQLNDDGDSNRRLISAYDSGGYDNNYAGNGQVNRAIINFSDLAAGQPSFQPQVAISLSPLSYSANGYNGTYGFGGVWQLVNNTGPGDIGTGAVGLPFLGPSNAADGVLNGTGSGFTSSGDTYSFSIPLSVIGVTPGNSFEFYADLISVTGYLSNESIGTSDAGSSDPGWGNVTDVKTVNSYQTAAVPEPSSVALLMGGLAGGIWAMARRNSGR